jgi:hypothetical protein
MAAAKPKKSYKPVKSFAVKKKAKKAKQVLLAVLIGGVLLGGLALAFVNMQKSQGLMTEASQLYECTQKHFDTGNCTGDPFKTTVSEKVVDSSTGCIKGQFSGGYPVSRQTTCTRKALSQPTNTNSTAISSISPTPAPPAGENLETILIGGTIYACDGSRLANVPVRAFDNTVTTNAQGNWQVTKNTRVIANDIQEFTVIAGKDVTSTHATTYTPRSAAPQFAKVNAGCGKIACDYKPSATSNSRGYSVNKYQFGTDMATYRKWFVTSTTAPNPLLGFDFKPVECAFPASANITVTAQPAAGGGVTVNARITPKTGLSVSKAQFAYRKKGATAWEASKLKNITNPANGVYSATYALGERVGTPGEYEFTVNVYFADGTTPCTGNGSYVGPWFTQCSGQKSAFVNWSTPSPND